MAASAVLVQSIFTALGGDPDFTTENISGTPATEAPVLTNLPSLITSLVSNSAFHDWLKLLLIGGIIEFCRRNVVVACYYAIYHRFFITAVFMDGDPSYDWLMVWLSDQPFWNNMREIEISTRSYGLDSDAVLLPGEEKDNLSVMNKGGRLLSHLPSTSTSHTFWYKHHWCRLRRLEQKNVDRDDYLELCILSWDRRGLDGLLLEAKKTFMAAREDKIYIHAADQHNEWRHVATRPPRPLTSVVLNPGLKEGLIGDIRDFLESKNWYSTRGIPFRRGYLFYGAPGSGKTSIIHSLAGELGLDVNIISLSRLNLDDSGLSELVSDLPEKCIILIEDIDVAFTTPRKRDLDDDNQADNDSKAPSPLVSRITLSGLLNALDGIAAQEGRLLFATTNKYEALDPALTRPGRLDVHIEFKCASKYQAQELYRNFFFPDSELIVEAEARSEAQAPESEVVDNFTDKSLIGVDEVGSNASETSTVIPSTSPSPSQKLIPLPDFTPRENTIRFYSRTKAPKLSKAEVNRLAAEFANALPEGEFSMASLQGYLLGYKTRASEAVTCFPAWIEKERLQKREKAKKNEKARESAKKRAREEKEKKSERAREMAKERAREKNEETETDESEESENERLKNDMGST